MESYLSPANYFTCTIQFLVFNLLSALGKALPVVKALYKFIYLLFIYYYNKGLLQCYSV